MAKYKKRKDGRYATTVTVSYDTDGKRKQRTIYGKTSGRIKNVQVKAFAKSAYVI